jgi:hypothetical protein
MGKKHFFSEIILSKQNLRKPQNFLRFHFLRKKEDFLRNGFLEIILLREDRDCALQPPNMFIWEFAAGICPNLIPGPALQDSATPSLRHIIRDLAFRAGHRISLDLFASASNTICPS